MVVTTNGLSLANTAALNGFDTDTHFAWGSGTTAEALGDTALVTELLRKAFDIASVKDTVNGTITFSGRVALGELNSSTINEMGIFNASSGGTMALRKLTSSGVTKTNSDELIFKIQVQVVSV